MGGNSNIYSTTTQEALKAMFDGSGNITNIDIDGGTIDDATIGATTGCTIHQYRTIPISANTMTPTATGFATAGTHEYATNDVNFDYYAFDGASEEYVEFNYLMPEQWDRSTIKVKFFWAPGDSACTAGDKVEWEIGANALSDDDAIDTTLGTAQVISDTVLVGKDADLHISGATPAITIGGTPALDDLIHFKISRNVGSANDDMTEDAFLFGIFIQYKETLLAVAW